MMTFEDLYRGLVKSAVRSGQLPENLPQHDAKHLDCLLHPERHPVVWKLRDCDCSEDAECAKSCVWNAIVKGPDGKMHIDMERCAGCGRCIDACKAKNLTESRDILPAIHAIRHCEGPAYALVAPAFLGQFGEDVTPGKLRSALKRLGFDGLLEVALFADILTLKEALEFDRNILTENDYQLTSSCCPMWIAMIRKIYKELMPHVPAAVSPMIASGRMIKQMHPDAVTVFIGPCVAKKAEAREKDLAGAVDYVLTFQELRDIFEFAEIDPAQEPESEKDHSSRAGRIYARSGGVSEAVQDTLARLSPMRAIALRPRQADGIPACKAMVDELVAGHVTANFFEGMGCVGGCVGGPKTVINREEGHRHVDNYGDKAQYPTPIDNPYVIELLNRLGLNTIDSLLEKSEIFTRTFD